MTKEELYQEIAKLGPEMSAGERMMKYFTGVCIRANIFFVQIKGVSHKFNLTGVKLTSNAVEGIGSRSSEDAPSNLKIK